MNTVTISQPTSGLNVTTATSGSSCGTNANGIITSNVTNGTAPYTYNWSNGPTTPNISNVAGGTYTLVVTDANGCTSPNVANMPTSVQPIADFNYTPIISCEGMFMQFTDASTNALTWSWDVPGVSSSNSQNPGFVFPFNGTYNVTLIVTNPPCADTVTKPILVDDMSKYFTIREANVFTPNGDLQNDCFLPALAGPGADTLKTCVELEVFDRWGIKMFESEGTNNCWKGTNKSDNKPAPDGTYYYIAKLGGTTIRGYVTLARHK